MSETKTQTFGEKAVGLSLHADSDPTVAKIKQLYAEIIDLCNDMRLVDGKGDKGRLASVAITQAQIAKMCAVEAATWKD